MSSVSGITSIASHDSYVTLADLSQLKQPVNSYVKTGVYGSQTASLGSTVVEDWNAPCSASDYSDTYSEGHSTSPKTTFDKSQASSDPKIILDEEAVVKEFKINTAKTVTVAVIATITLLSCMVLAYSGNMPVAGTLISLGSTLCQKVWSADIKEYSDIIKVIVDNFSNILKWFIEVQSVASPYMKPSSV
jgi:hypothetical protein